jgi:hypothetical protein
MRIATISVCLTMGCIATVVAQNKPIPKEWRVETNTQWVESCAKADGLEVKDGMIVPTAKESVYKSSVRRFKEKRKPTALVISQSPVWHNWQPTENLGPSNLRDAPVFLIRGSRDYWIFGRYGNVKPKRRKGKKPQPKPAKPFVAADATLEGFDVPLKTTPFPNQYNAPGGLKKGLGGYHAWQSRDMKNWVHHAARSRRTDEAHG